MQLHQRFVEAVEQLGLKNAVPKTIMQVLSQRYYSLFCLCRYLRMYLDLERKVLVLSSRISLSLSG